MAERDEEAAREEAVLIESAATNAARFRRQEEERVESDYMAIRMAKQGIEKHKIQASIEIFQVSQGFFLKSIQRQRGEELRGLTVSKLVSSRVEDEKRKIAKRDMLDNLKVFMAALSRSHAAHRKREEEEEEKKKEKGSTQTAVIKPNDQSELKDASRTVKRRFWELLPDPSYSASDFLWFVLWNLAVWNFMHHTFLLFDCNVFTSPPGSFCGS